MADIPDDFEYDHHDYGTDCRRYNYKVSSPVKISEEKQEEFESMIEEELQEIYHESINVIVHADGRVLIDDVDESEEMLFSVLSNLDFSPFILKNKKLSFNSKFQLEK